VNIAAVTKSAIIRNLSFIPNTDLDNVRTYIQFLLDERKIPVPKNQSLKGMWKNVGFEKLISLEDELSSVRHQLQDAILQRVI
jgi:hypothetical protein